MSDAAEHASERGRFAAREFIARYLRETGQQPPADFAYEMGYLRGRSDATADSVEMFEELSRSREQPRKDDGNDDTE